MQCNLARTFLFSLGSEVHERNLFLFFLLLLGFLSATRGARSAMCPVGFGSSNLCLLLQPFGQLFCYGFIRSQSTKTRRYSPAVLVIPVSLAGVPGTIGVAPVDASGADAVCDMYLMLARV